MMITKILTYASTMTKSKKAKIALLVIEIAILAYVIYQKEQEDAQEQKALALNSAPQDR